MKYLSISFLLIGLICVSCNKTDEKEWYTCESTTHKIYYGFGGGCCPPHYSADTSDVLMTAEELTEYEAEGNYETTEQFGPGESADVTRTRTCWEK